MTHYIAALNRILTLLLQCLKNQAAIREGQVRVELNLRCLVVGATYWRGYMLSHIWDKQLSSLALRKPATIDATRIGMHIAFNVAFLGSIWENQCNQGSTCLIRKVTGIIAAVQIQSPIDGTQASSFILLQTSIANYYSDYIQSWSIDKRPPVLPPSQMLSVRTTQQLFNTTVPQRWHCRERSSILGNDCETSLQLWYRALYKSTKRLMVSPSSSNKPSSQHNNNQKSHSFYTRNEHIQSFYFHSKCNLIFSSTSLSWSLQSPQSQLLYQLRLHFQVFSVTLTLRQPFSISPSRKPLDAVSWVSYHQQ